VRERVIPALRFGALTRFYDPVMAGILREATWKAQLVAQVGATAGMRVLDLGCGTGTLTLLLAQTEPGALVAGIDADPEALNRARAKAAAAGTTVELVEGLSSALPFPDASFDRVVSSLLFHHLSPEGKRTTLAEARRVLRSDGELHIADWGRPHDALMRAAFLPVQLLDGFATTADNVRGVLPTLVAAAGFDSVRETRRRRTLFGTLTFLLAGADGVTTGEQPRLQLNLTPHENHAQAATPRSTER
jgi:ubiquinone/menaquinone biosynthesis C-methylase UbiE